MDSYTDFLRFAVIMIVIAVPALAFQFLFNPNFFRRGRNSGGDDGSTSYSPPDPFGHSSHGGHDGGDSGDSGGHGGH